MKFALLFLILSLFASASGFAQSSLGSDSSFSFASSSDPRILSDRPIEKPLIDSASHLTAFYMDEKDEAFVTTWEVSEKPVLTFQIEASSSGKTFLLSTEGGSYSHFGFNLLKSPHLQPKDMKIFSAKISVADKNLSSTIGPEVYTLTQIIQPRFIANSRDELQSSF